MEGLIIKQSNMKKDDQQEKLLICKPCGYVMKESELGDVCPACGLPRKVFEQYKERMSPGRSRILRLDLHPIAVHFPQTILVFLLLALLLNLFFPHFYPQVLLGTATFTAVVFPFAVFGAFLSGLIDGKLRFKSVTTPVLTKKIIFSSVMFAASIFTPFLVSGGIEPIRSRLLLLACGAIALACAIVLGHAGKRLMNIGMGGDVKIWGWKI
jgi:rubredoxin